MANTIVNKQPVWTDVVSVELSAPSGSAAGETNSILIPGGNWKITSAWGIKETEGASTDTRIDIGVSGSDDTYTEAVLICTGAIQDGEILPFLSGTVAAELYLSGASDQLRVSGGQYLSLRSKCIGGSGNGSASVFINLVAVQPE